MVLRSKVKNQNTYWSSAVEWYSYISYIFSGHINEYGVNYSKLKPKSRRADRKEVLCRIKNIKFKLLNEQSSPLFQGMTFPTEPLFGVDPSTSDTDNTNPEPIYRSCAVIPNSAAFDGSRHGIDVGKQTLEFGITCYLSGASDSVFIQ